MIRWSAGVDPLTGRRIRGKRTIRGTKADAEKALTKEQDRVDSGVTLSRSRYTFGGWLDEWLENWCNEVTDRTRHDYRATIRMYVPPALRAKRLTAVSAVDLQALLNSLLERDLSPRTVRGVRAVLRIALNCALRLGFVRQNVATLVKPPALPKREKQALDAAQSQRFLATARDDRWYALWALLVSTGLRPGEALALKWSDLEGNSLRIQRTLVRVPNEGWRFEEPKTKRSRPVVLPSSVIRALTRHHARQAEERLLAGEDYQDLGLIFSTAIGGPLNSKNLTARYFKPLLKRAELPEIRLYDLRHTAASLAMKNNVHPKVVAEMLGHASIMHTMDTYSHVMPDMQAESAERLDELLFG
jgi:integrase